MHNILIHKTTGGSSIAEFISEGLIITTIQDALDRMMEADVIGARSIILHEKNITPDFFNLPTGFAGNLLQKYVNYQVKLAVVGNFSKYSKNFQAFITECNRGRQFFFLDNTSDAIKKLS